jgi:hypothetical protein
MTSGTVVTFHAGGVLVAVLGLPLLGLMLSQAINPTLGAAIGAASYLLIEVLFSVNPGAWSRRRSGGAR